MLPLLTVPACPAVASWLEANTPPLKVPDPNPTTRQKALAGALEHQQIHVKMVSRALLRKKPRPQNFVTVKLYLLSQSVTKI
jgi:hypothetical protein